MNNSTPYLYLYFVLYSYRARASDVLAAQPLGPSTAISDPSSPGNPMKISPAPPKCHPPISASKLFSTTPCPSKGGELLCTSSSKTSLSAPAGILPFLAFPGEFLVLDLVMRPARVFCRGAMSSKAVLAAFAFPCDLAVDVVGGGEVESQCSSGKFAARRLILRKWPSMAS